MLINLSLHTDSSNVVPLPILLAPIKLKNQLLSQGKNPFIKAFFPYLSIKPLN
ncbi:hypothetical protein ES705_46779 [subsurface metagenome]